MAKNRKIQTADLRFGPVLKVVLLCALIGGSAIGYVWQKNQNYLLDRRITEHEARLKQAVNDNQKLKEQVEFLKLPVMIDQRVKDLKLGLVPETTVQVVHIPEPKPSLAEAAPRQFAQGLAAGGMPHQ